MFHYTVSPGTGVRDWRVSGACPLPRLAYMTKRLKYCCRWRPCSETSRLSRLSTALSRWSLRLSQPWVETSKVSIAPIRTRAKIGSRLQRHLPDWRVRARRWARGRARLAARSGRWRRWAWRRRLAPRRSGTRAGTRRSGWGTQTGRCVQTNSEHSYCVWAGCRGRRTWVGCGKQDFKYYFERIKSAVVLVAANQGGRGLPVTGRTPHYFLGVETCAEEKPSSQLSTYHSNLLRLWQEVVLAW